MKKRTRASTGLSGGEIPVLGTRASAICEVGSCEMQFGQGRQIMHSQSRAARWAITSGLAAFLAIAAAGFPTQAHAFVCNGQFDLLQKGYCSTTTTQGCGTSVDAPSPRGEACKTFGCFASAEPAPHGAGRLRL